MSNTPSTKTSNSELNSGLLEKIMERREEQPKSTITPKHDNDGDLHHELHEEFERQQSDKANAWRFG